jgi:hypothetical protein
MGSDNEKTWENILIFFEYFQKAFSQFSSGLELSCRFINTIRYLFEKDLQKSFFYITLIS